MLQRILTYLLVRSFEGNYFKDGIEGRKGEIKGQAKWMKFSTRTYMYNVRNKKKKKDF